MFGIVIGIIIGVIILLYFLADRAEKFTEKVNKEKGIEVRDFNSKYIGGFQDVIGGIKADIMVKQNEIQIGLWRTGKIDYKFIPMDIVINAEIKSENQIAKEVSLGKMIVFGALAFAMKNEKSVVKNYLVISCDENGYRRDLVFESNYSERLVKEIRRIKNIESAF